MEKGTPAQKRLVYILHELEIGGVELALIAGLETLSAHFDLKVICLGNVNKSLINHLPLPIQERILSVPFRFLQWNKIKHKVFQILRDFQPEMMISSLWKAHALATYYLKQRQKSSLSPCLYFPFFHSAQFAHPLDAYYSKKALRIATTVWTDSRATQEFIEQYTSRPIKKISFITVPTTSQYPYPLYPHNQQFKAIFVGRLASVKNLKKAIQLIAILRNEGIYMTYDIYGPGEDYWKQELLPLVRKMQLEDAIKYKGVLPPHQRMQVMSQYHFYIQTSDVEGMAMSVVEAMIAGLIPLVTAVGEIKNYVQEGVSGIYIEEEKSLTLQKQIKEVVLQESIFLDFQKEAVQVFKHQPNYDQSIINELKLYV